MQDTHASIRVCHMQEASGSNWFHTDRDVNESPTSVSLLSAVTCLRFHSTMKQADQNTASSDGSSVTRTLLV